MFDQPPIQFAGIFESYSKWQPERAAIVTLERETSWRDLNARANQVANALLRASLRPGDRIAVLMGNRVEAVEILLGVIKAGMVIVPLSTMLSREALMGMIDDSGAKALFVAADLADTLLSDESSATEKLLRLVLDRSLPDCFDYARWVADASAAEPRIDRDSEDELAIMYSSGTTGSAKGIIHTHRSRLHLAVAMALALGIESRSVALLATPHYANGTWLTMLPTLVSGGTIAMASGADADSLISDIQKHGVTHIFMVPTQLRLLFEALERQPLKLASLRAVLSAGAPLHPALKKGILDVLGGRLLELYGCTEGIGTLIHSDQMADRPDSVGRPLFGLDLAIIDDEDLPVKHNVPGEIVGYGPGLMKGYHNRPDETASAIWRDASGRTWLRTGDIGALDSDGFLRILDRKKDMIISGGINIYPHDIEDVMLEHPDVAEATVIGTPDEKWGESPLAIVVLRPQAAVSTEELKEWTNARLSRHQWLRMVEVTDSLPRNALGKVLKRELRDAHVARSQ